MSLHPLFIDDASVAQALDEASQAAISRLAGLLPELAGPAGDAARTFVRTQLAALLLGENAACTGDLAPMVHGQDAFGHRFELADLPLPRASRGYAVQLLDTDTLLDRATGNFLPVRDSQLQGLFDSFAAAHAAARNWIKDRGTSVEVYPLAIVPAGYDEEMRRHVLIYGVLPKAP